MQIIQKKRHRISPEERLLNLRELTLSHIDEFKDLSSDKFVDVVIDFLKKFFRISQTFTFIDIPEILEDKRLKKGIRRKIILFSNKLSTISYGKKVFTQKKLQPLVSEFRSIVLILTAGADRKTGAIVEATSKVHEVSGAVTRSVHRHGSTAGRVVHKFSKLVVLLSHIFLVRIGLIKPKGSRKSKFKPEIKTVISAERIEKKTDQKKPKPGLFSKLFKKAEHESEVLHDDLHSLLEKIDASLGRSELTEAGHHYKKLLSLYNKMTPDKQREIYPKFKQIHGRIARIHQNTH